MLSLALIAALWLGPPEAPGPPRWANGTGSMAVGATMQALSLGGGIAGVALGGSWGRGLTLFSALPSAVGGGMVITGAWLHGRQQGWYDARDLRVRTRTARRVGWSLFGVGLGLFAGGGAALLAWPLERPCFEGCAARYPEAMAVVGSGFLLGQLMVTSGSSAVAWSFAYSKARARRVEFTPTIGGMSMRF